MAECEDLDCEVQGPLFDEEFTEINASTTTDEALRKMVTALQEANPVIALSHDPVLLCISENIVFDLLRNYVFFNNLSAFFVMFNMFYTIYFPHEQT